MIQGVLNDGNNIFLHMYYALFFLGSSNIMFLNRYKRKQCVLSLDPWGILLGSSLLHHLPLNILQRGFCSKETRLVVNATQASLFIYLFISIESSYEISKGFEEFFWSTFLLFGFSHKLVQTKKMTSFGPLS